MGDNRCEWCGRPSCERPDDAWPLWAEAMVLVRFRSVILGGATELTRVFTRDRDEPQRHPPPSRPRMRHRSLPEQQLTRDTPIQQHRPACAECAHDGGHLGGREPKWKIRQHAAQALEASHCEENMP